MATQVLKLPRLSSNQPIANLPTGGATQSLTIWWNQVCDALEGAIDTLQTQQEQIDEALGLAGQANSGANSANSAAAAANQAIATIHGLTPIANGDLLANTSGVPALPVDTSLSELIDTAVGSTQGDILYRNASGWVVLPPGTAGQKLTTGGAGANPSWT